MSSIRNMIGQAEAPDEDQDSRPAEAIRQKAQPRRSAQAATPRPPAEPAPTPVPATTAVAAPVIDLPDLPVVEARVSLSTRMTPSLQDALRAYVAGYRSKGYRVTGEIVLECLMEELLGDAALQARVAARAIRKR